VNGGASPEVQRSNPHYIIYIRSGFSISPISGSKDSKPSDFFTNRYKSQFTMKTANSQALSMKKLGGNIKHNRFNVFN
jgi:hypothetical protein